MRAKRPDSRRRGGAGGPGGRRGPGWIRAVPTPILVLLGVLVLAAAYRLLAPGAGAHAGHPEPRAGVSAARVLTALPFSSDPGIEETYRLAREVPQVLDGLYCYCDCSRHAGHRSLLECFESSHGAACDICLQEARIAHRMHQDGRSLDEIRGQIDAMFGRG